jgi:hypothetical protein
MTPTSDDIKSLSQTLAEYTVWATQQRTLADYIEYKMLKIQLDLNAIEIAQLKGKCDELHAERLSAYEDIARETTRRYELERELEFLKKRYVEPHR